MSKQHYDSQGYRAQDNISYLMKRGHSLMVGTMEPVLEARGFTFMQYVILAWLRDGVAVNPKDICTMFRHDSGALTRVIDQLSERGLLERVRRDRDRRKVELVLTDAGRTTVEGLIPLVVEKLNSALDDFTATEAHELQRLLRKLNTRLLATVEPVKALADVGV